MATKQVSGSPIQKYGLLIPQMFLPWIQSAAWSVIAYSIRDWNIKYRWIIGFGLIELNNKTGKYTKEAWSAILPKSMMDPRYHIFPVILGGTVGMMMGVFTGFFGGDRYYEKHGINSHRKALVASLCSGQVYFRKNTNARQKALMNLMRIGGYLSVGYALAKSIRSGLVSKKFIESNVILHMETVGLMVSILMFASNIAANIHYFIFGNNDNMEVIEPYGFTFFSKCIRQFWKQWSRPVGEFLRYMVYDPLGGRDRFWLSVPALFAMNCFFHYDMSQNLYGYKAVSEWNKAFAVMGASMAVYVASENIFLKKKKKRIVDASQLENIDESKSSVAKSNAIDDSLYWKVWSYGLFNASMMTALYFVKDKALIMNLENGCNTILLENLDVKI